MQTQIIPRRVIEEETEELGEKPLTALQAVIDPLDNQLGYKGKQETLPLYLSPPTSYSNKASRNRILSSSLDPATSSILHLPSLASSKVSQQHQNLTGHSQNVWYVFGLLTPQWYGN